MKTRSRASAEQPRRPSQHKIQANGRVKKVDSARGSSHRDRTQFLWVPYPEDPDIAEDIGSRIGASNLSGTFLDQYPMYNDENMAMIESRLGKGFATRVVHRKANCEKRLVHQGVATMQHLRHSFHRDVDFRSWQWLNTQLGVQPSRTMDTRSTNPPQSSSSTTILIEKHPLLDSTSTIPAIVFLHWTRAPDPPTTAIHAAITTLRSNNLAVIRAFPSQTETTFEVAKLDDLHALDEIAAQSPAEHSYRPLTCFKHGQTKHDMRFCCLNGLEQIVMKRSHSSGGEHVQLIDGHEPGPDQRNKKNVAYTWFGQALEPFFSTFGEFRVFIVAKSDPAPINSASSSSSTAAAQSTAQGVRGRHGTVLHIVITTWPPGNDEPEDMYARAASAIDFTSPHVAPLTLSDLHDFALHVFESLRRRDDWQEHFESLEMGVRLDICIGSSRAGANGAGAGGGSKKSKKAKGKGKERAEDGGEGEKRFFVNEITRWYQGDFFSEQTLGEPKQQVA